MIVVLLFFIDILAFKYDVIDLAEPQLDLPEELEPYFDFLIWPLAVLLVSDLVIKYRKVNDPKKFVKKYWIDIVMLALIPIFSALKFLKVGVSLVKKIKALKMGTKVTHKTKNP